MLPGMRPDVTVFELIIFWSIWGGMPLSLLIYYIYDQVVIQPQELHLKKQYRTSTIIAEALADEKFFSKKNPTFEDVKEWIK